VQTPLNSSYSIPPIPSSYKVFGITYPNTNFPPNDIKLMINKSFSKYLSLLDTCDYKLIEEIEDIHLKINEVLNDNKGEEVESKLKILRNKNIKKKNDILNKLNKMLY
jgi:hypothetical protein